VAFDSVPQWVALLTPLAEGERLEQAIGSIYAGGGTEIYPALAADQPLLDFLRRKGIEDPRAHIEQKLLHTMVQDILTGFVAGNMGMHQTTLCYLAIVLDNDDPARGPTTATMREWLMRGGGRVEDILWNGFRREGLGAESAPGYASGWGVYFYEVAELLPRLGVNIWSIPKLKKMADIGLDLTVAGQFCPSIGDSGSSRGCGLVGWSAALQGVAFTHYRDPRHAQALVRIKATSRALFHDYFDEEEVARVAARYGDDLGWKTRDLGGYGLAILESGEGEHRRGLSLYYGDASGGHGHADRLNIEMFSHGTAILPDDGYPTPFTRPNFYEWRRANTFRHYCVMVDELPHLTYHAGHLNTLVSTPGVQLADASGESAYPGMVSLYRRTSALVDISAEASYLLDVFRVRGGQQHDWCFHGPLFPEFTTTGG
ncbi:MAG: heparinase II/III family protein, partial [Armatimonadota bacterium]|nr:heparinase II/III family protein [Armatimonadota bacterium]